MRLLPLILLLLVGCAGSTHVLVGEKRSPINPDLVKVYRSPPSQFEEIAIIEGNTNNSLAITEQGQVDHVIQEMKRASAKLGANGVVVESIYYDAMLGRIGRGTAIFVISE